MQQLEQLRDAVNGLRDADQVRASMNVQTDVGFASSTPSRRAVIDADDLNAIATRHRREGEADGHEAGYRVAAEIWQGRLAVAEKEAETRGALAGIWLAIVELDRRVNELVSDEAASEAHRVGGPVDVALDVPRDRLSQLHDALRESGVHGERAPLAGALDEFVREMGRR